MNRETLIQFDSLIKKLLTTYYDVKLVEDQLWHWSNYGGKYNVEVTGKSLNPLPVLHYIENNLRCPTLYL